MKRYRCHKVVQAGKILRFRAERGQITGLVLEDGDELFVDESYSEKVNRGPADDNGYFVHYEDGYESWSPTKAFEEGYSLDDGSVFGPEQLKKLSDEELQSLIKLARELASFESEEIH